MAWLAKKPGQRCLFGWHRRTYTTPRAHADRFKIPRLKPHLLRIAAQNNSSRSYVSSIGKIRIRVTFKRLRKQSEQCRLLGACSIAFIHDFSAATLRSVLLWIWNHKAAGNLHSACFRFPRVPGFRARCAPFARRSSFPVVEGPKKRIGIFVAQ